MILGAIGLLGGALVQLALSSRSMPGERGPASAGPGKAASAAPAPARDHAPAFGRTAPALPSAQPDGVAGDTGAHAATAGRPALEAVGDEPLAARVLDRLPRALLEPRLAAQRRSRRARARFDRGVAEHDVRASQLAPAVEDLFDSMDLKPMLDEQGMLEGMTIASLEPGSLMHGAGFRPADRLTRIDGTRLRDPADLPPLLLRLGTRIDICAERAGEELCREIALD